MSPLAFLLWVPLAHAQDVLWYWGNRGYNDGLSTLPDVLRDAGSSGMVDVPVWPDDLSPYRVVSAPTTATAATHAGSGSSASLPPHWRGRASKPS